MDKAILDNPSDHKDGDKPIVVNKGFSVLDAYIFPSNLSYAIENSKSLKFDMEPKIKDTVYSWSGLVENGYMGHGLLKHVLSKVPIYIDTGDGNLFFESFMFFSTNLSRRINELMYAHDDIAAFYRKESEKSKN